MHRSGPSNTKESLIKRIGALEIKITWVKDLYVDGDISKEEYGERKSALEEHIVQVRDELSKFDDIDGAMKRIDRLRDALLYVESPFSGHYVLTGNVDLEVAIEHGLSYGSKNMTAQRRMEFYRRVGLHVKVGQEIEISLDIGGSPVSKLDDPSSLPDGPMPQPDDKEIRRGVWEPDRGISARNLTEGNPTFTAKGSATSGPSSPIEG
jgi:hypothetical protein